MRGPSDLYRGIGSNTNDPFEAFRKNRSGTFIQKLKERDEKLQKMKKLNGRHHLLKVKQLLVNHSFVAPYYY